MIESDLIQIATEIANLRQLQYILRSPEFLEVYANQPEPAYYIQTRNCDALKRWIRSQKLGDLEAYNVKTLRLMARDLKIRDYHLLTKVELIQGIRICRVGQQSSMKS